MLGTCIGGGEEGELEDVSIIPIKEKPSFMQATCIHPTTDRDGTIYRGGATRRCTDNTVSFLHACNSYLRGEGS